MSQQIFYTLDRLGSFDLKIPKLENLGKEWSIIIHLPSRRTIPHIFYQYVLDEQKQFILVSTTVKVSVATFVIIDSRTFAINLRVYDLIRNVYAVIMMNHS